MAASKLSSRAKASAYAPPCTSSSICSVHDFIENDHSVLPSAVAVVRSVAIVNTYSGDFAPGEHVSRRAE